jgi:hypothetical protein
MALEHLKCFRCEKPGHVAANCDELIPAASKAEHDARIALYIRRWTEGKWTAREKQRAISEENKMEYGKDCRAALT